jgi:hypothetical protein
MGFLTPSGRNRRRVYQYGYRCDEVKLPEFIYEEGPDKEIVNIKSKNFARRMPQAVGLLHVVRGAAMCRPDQGDHLSLIQGVKKRLLSTRPVLNKERLGRLRAFVRRWLSENLSPLARSDVLEPEAWIEQCNQPQSRKEEYLEALKRVRSGDCNGLQKRRKIKTFMKDEGYMEWKYPRSINARCDEMKVLVGPIFKAVEKRLFSNPWFIKKVPRRDWPKYIQERCGRAGVSCFASDFSSFEASFTPDVMEAIEMELYHYMLSDIAFEEELELIESLVDTNQLENAGFAARVKGRRMSGEMNTSLGNGFSNKMVNLFVLDEKGCTDVCGVIEGDDGLFVFNGPVPTSEDYLDLGFEIKLEEHSAYNEASFCGVVFAEEAGHNLIDPYKILASCSWTCRDYWAASDSTLRMLRISKGLSYLAQNPGCPVVQSIALWMLRTVNYDPKEKDSVLSWVLTQRSFDYWQRRIVTETAKTTSIKPLEIHMASRLLIERKFGMSVGEQIRLEHLFDTSDGDVDIMGINLPGNLSQSYTLYVRECSVIDSSLFWPLMPPATYPLQDMEREDYHINAPDGRYH